MRHPGAGFSHYGEGRWSHEGRFGEHGWSNGYYGYYGGLWDDLPYYGGGEYGVQPSTIVLIQAPPSPEPLPPPPPPPPASPAVHEYSWPDSGGDAATAFLIAGKDGTVQRAIAVWVQDNQLCFITPDGISRALTANEIDRQNTARLNAELGLKLSLPVQVEQALPPAEGGLKPAAD